MRQWIFRCVLHHETLKRFFFIKHLRLATGVESVSFLQFLQACLSVDIDVFFSRWVLSPNFGMTSDNNMGMAIIACPKKKNMGMAITEKLRFQLML